VANRTPLREQLDTIERLLERAKVEQDWPAIPPLKAVRRQDLPDRLS
jgi:hypothetical protein